MNGTLYYAVLQQELTQSMRTNPRTRSNKIWRLAIRQNSKLKLNVLEWPAKSPHFNPIEMFYSILDKKLVSELIYSIMEVRQRFEEK